MMFFAGGIQMSLKQMQEALGILRNEVYEDLPIRQAQIFLYIVGKASGTSLIQIAEDLDIPKGPVSRAVKMLALTVTERTSGTKTIKETDGYDLLEVRQDPVAVGNQKLVTLSKRGKALASKLKKIMGEENGKAQESVLQR